LTVPAVFPGEEDLGRHGVFDRCGRAAREEEDEEEQEGELLHRYHL
jgi:hypothetical protein